MGQLEHPRTAMRHCLRDEHVVGRHESADLRLTHSVTSNLHATLRWADGGWVIRDLGSRNGVFVNGERIAGTAALREGATLGFGSPEDPFRLADAGGPRAFAVSLRSGLEVQGTVRTLGLPDAKARIMSVSRSGTLWIAETGQEVTAVSDGSVVEAGGSWRLYLPRAHSPTTSAAGIRVGLDEITILLRVSRDHEHIEIDVTHRGGPRQIGHYAANELLLVLAHARLADARGDSPPDPAEGGWVYFDDLVGRLGLCATDPRDVNRVRQWMHSLRRRFERIGIDDGERIVERRSGTREVRLGTAHVQVASP